jgi:hypothetical protein
MNTTIKVIGVLLMMMIFNKTSFAQNGGFNRIGNINNEIFLDKYEGHYLLSYNDISMDSEGNLVSFQLADREAVVKLYQELKNSFSNKSSNPLTITTGDNELRIYFNERPIKADYVEVIHEDLKTETTTTVPWLILKELEQLFGSVIN